MLDSDAGSSPAKVGRTESAGAPGTDLGSRSKGPLGFMGWPCARELKGAQAAVLGAPLDLGTSIRPGARFGPQAIRDMSLGLAEQIVPPKWADARRVLDCGDVVFNPGDLDDALSGIEQAAWAVVSQGVRLLTLGGDHTVTLPLLRAHARRYGPVALVHFDSHMDTNAELSKPYHGSIFTTAANEGLVDLAHSIHLGIRTNVPNMIGRGYGFKALTADWVIDSGPAATADRIRSVVGNGKAYLTFDIDFLDPAYAPGTSTPVMGGPSSAECRRILQLLRGLDVVGADVVEVSPPYDGPASLAALAGASIAFFILDLMLAERKSDS